MFGWLRRLFDWKSATPVLDTPDNRQRTIPPFGSKVTGAPQLQSLAQLSTKLDTPPAPLLPLPVAPIPATAQPAWLACMPATVLFADVETTGFNAETDRIVSFAGILVTTADLARGLIDIEYGHYIVDPGRICHPRAAAVHGYSDWLLRHQPPFAEIIDTVVELIEKAELVVAHNAQFDVDFINAELSALGRPAIAKPVYCTVQGYRALNRGGSARLDDVAAQMGLSRAGPRHGALEDAWLAMMVYFWLHDCPYRMRFSAFSDPRPRNLRSPPPMPDHAEPSTRLSRPCAICFLAPMPRRLR